MTLGGDGGGGGTYDDLKEGFGGDLDRAFGVFCFFSVLLFIFFFDFNVGILLSFIFDFPLLILLLCFTSRFALFLRYKPSFGFEEIETCKCVCLYFSFFFFLVL